MAVYQENGSNMEGEEFKLFIGGLHWETTEEHVKAYFSKEPYGPVKSVIIKMHPENKSSRCFGFVEFVTREGMEAVLQDKDGPGHIIGGKKIDPKPAEPATGGHKTNKIFVGGVPPDLPEGLIRAHFKEFGEIEDIVLVLEKGQKEKRRGFVFITYTNSAAVDQVIAKQKFHEIGPDKIRVEVKRAVPKNQQSRNKYNSANNVGRGGFPAPAYHHPTYPNFNFQGAAFGYFGGGYANYPAYGYGGAYGGGQAGGYGYGGPAGGSTQGYGGTGAGTAAYNRFFTSGPGGPMKSNYHQGSTNFHPYSR